jgi:hypothetical protein
MKADLPVKDIFGHRSFSFARQVFYQAGEDRSQGLAAQAVGAQRRALTAATGGRIENHRAKEIKLSTATSGRGLRVADFAPRLHAICVQLILITGSMPCIAGSMYPPSTAGMS